MLAEPRGLAAVRTASPDDKSDRARRKRWAIRAAQCVAVRYGVRVEKPLLLDDCNNTVVHLAPSSLVAKVSDGRRRPNSRNRLERELEIGLHLAREGAPIAPPSLELPTKVHRYRDQVLTFWQFQQAGRATCIDGLVAARTLLEVHRGLDSFRGDLPSFLERQAARAGMLLTGQGGRLTLTPGDQAFLAAEHVRLTAAIRTRQFCWRPLHGDPHRENLLAVGNRCLLIDFESCCLGPAEWDLSALPGGGGSLWRAVDRELLALTRRLRSLCVLVWCRTQAAGPQKLALAAQQHLRFLHEEAHEPAA